MKQTINSCHIQLITENISLQQNLRDAGHMVFGLYFLVSFESKLFHKDFIIKDNNKQRTTNKERI